MIFAHQPTATTVDVTFAVASYNSQKYLEVAVRSALKQTSVSVEVIIVDDGSTDKSLALAQRLAAEDKRVRVLTTPQNGGPSAARNVALEHMLGRWFAVLDSDDILMPERSRRLIDLAERDGFNIVADNLEVFGDRIDSELFISGLPEARAIEVSLDHYFKNSCLFAKTAGYGFLKPIIQRSVIETEALRYDETIRVGEDDELMVRLLAKGYRYGLTGYVGYRYRKHDSSISHRLSSDKAHKMLDIERSLQRRIEASTFKGPAYRKRWNSIRNGVVFVDSVEALKSRNFFLAARLLLKRPLAIGLYRMPLRAALSRLIGKA